MPAPLTTPTRSRLAHHEPAASRRDFLLKSGAGFGGLALTAMMASDTPSAESMRARSGHNRTPARSVIFLFMDGGPSHIDTFDPKPEVNRLAGQALPESIERVITPMGVSENPLLPTRRTWRQYGDSGLPVSDWYPHVAQHADELCVIRSCQADGLNHVGSVCQMNTGSILAGRPSLGAWVAYGLGSSSQNLPGFVVLLDNDREPPGGTRVWLVEWAVGEIGADRILYGTDTPLYQSEMQRARIDHAELTDQHKQLILRENAVALLDLPPPPPSAADPTGDEDS